MKLITRTNKRYNDGRLLSIFLCDCGNEKLLPHGRVVNGYIQSCGCKKGKHESKHGMRNTDEYVIWTGLKQRVTNPKNKDYHRYGAKFGISDTIRNSFEAFYNEVGKRPSKIHSIDRINNSLGYIEGNLRWATPKEQAENRNRTIYIHNNGKKTMLVDYANNLGITYGATWQRLKRGTLGVEKCN